MDSASRAGPVQSSISPSASQGMAPEGEEQNGKTAAAPDIKTGIHRVSPFPQSKIPEYFQFNEKPFNRICGDWRRCGGFAGRQDAADAETGHS